jgi:hypothetical protein
MPTTYYVLPYGKYSTTKPNANVPKYISNTNTPPEIQTESYSLINMGVEGECVAAVTGDTLTVHDLLTAKADVIRIVDRADIGNALTAAQANGAATKLEARKIPGDWVVAGMTWKKLLNNVARIFLFCQYLHGEGLYEQILADPLTLESKFQDLSADVQSRLQAAATFYGYAAIPPGKRMRAVFKSMFEEWNQSASIYLGGEEL